MKKSYQFLILALVFGCTENNDSTTKEVLRSNNNELQILRDADQLDRRDIENIDWSIVSVRDSLRRERVSEMLDSSLVVTSKDYHNAALIFQHGHDTIASGMAVSLMTKAIELDTSINKWLLAAATDRDLMRKDLPQIYGTQFRKNTETDEWYLYEVDTTIVSPEKRAQYGVPTLAEARLRAIKMNQKKIAELINDGKSVDEVVAFCESENPLKSEYDISENALNNFGYEFMGDKQFEDALKIFKLATELYPDAGNAYDSYGECLLALGRTAESLDAYKKSVLLAPNDYGQNMVDSLELL